MTTTTTMTTATGPLLRWQPLLRQPRRGRGLTAREATGRSAGHARILAHPPSANMIALPSQ
eukprot:9503297-Pyramimonas_sp.AAC.1